MIDIGDAALVQRDCSYARLGGHLWSVAAEVLFTQHDHKHFYK